jgi:hypothetical protein
MKFGRIVRGLVVGIVGAALLVLSGCAVEPSDDGAPEGDVGQAAEAIGTECADASPTVVSYGYIDYISPQWYTKPNCYKAVVMDVYDVVAGDIYMDWQDAIPTTQAACEQAWMRVDVFEIVGGVPQYRGHDESFGSWLGSWCYVNVLMISEYTHSGKDYRIAATARTDNTSAAPTRRFRVFSVSVDSDF